MRNKQGIRWKEAIGNDLHSENFSARSMSVFAEMLLDVVCVVVFMCAARIMLADVYQWGGPDGNSVLTTAIAVILVDLILESAFMVRKSIGRWIRWSVPLVMALAFVGYLQIGTNGKIVEEGLLKIGSEYIRDWNQYYGTALWLSGGNQFCVAGALDTVMPMIFAVLLWAAKMVKKNLLPAIVPILVFALELLAGLCPVKADGLFLMFFGILLVNAFRWKWPDFLPAPGKQSRKAGGLHSFSWIRTAAGILVFCLIVSLTGVGFAKNLVLHSGNIQDYMAEIRERLNDLDFGKFDAKVEQLDNNSPKYDYVPALTITMDEKPQGSIYLKGFYGDQYDDGSWTADLKSFKEACRVLGWDSEEMTQNIAFLAVRKLAAIYNVSNLASSVSGSQITIKYEEGADARAYFPYFAEVSDADVSIEGDSRFKRPSSLTTTTAVIWNYAGLYGSRLNLFEYAGEQEWEDWYEGYVLDHYLEVPDDMTTVKQLAAQLDTHETSSGGNQSSYEINLIRMEKADRVVQWMEKNTRYSLYPPALPGGMDPVEYFLGTSQVGYCMHYASASVMLLRQMGVPAKMVVGYMVGSDAFKRTGTVYTATLQDNEAHAWVEIYLDGIGWVPVEVTKGFSEYASQIQPDDPPETTPPETTPEESDPPETTPEEPDTPQTRPQESSSQDIAPSDDETTQPDETTGGTKPDVGKIARILLPIIGIVLVVTVVFYVLLKLKREYREQLIRAMRRRRTAHAIRTINRRIYRKLCLTGKVVKRDLRDSGYEALLKKTYPEVSDEEWERYMEIVKAAAFSKRDIPVDDMDFCYEIYRIVYPYHEK